MRISDWSSDVCSSDLVDTLQLAEIVGRMNARQNRVGILLRPATLLDVLAKHLDGIALAFFSSDGVAINTDDLDSCESGDQDNACSRHRPEEHTTAVQSLIPTSYAVFVLTKTHKKP